MNKFLKIALVLATLMLLIHAATPSGFAQEPEPTPAPTATPGPGGSDCSQANPPNYCTLIEEGEIQVGSYTAPKSIQKFVVGAAGEEVTFYPANGPFDNGCVRGQFSTSESGFLNDTVYWEKYGDGESCHEISHLEIWWEVHPTAIGLKSFTAEPADSNFNALDWFGILILALGFAFLQYEWRRRRRK